MADGIKCQMCGGEFKTREELEKHNKEAHGK
jgi:uncharacterized C2H2 Zn-finger protein